MIPLMFSSQAKIGNFKKRKRPLSPGQALSCQLTELSQMQTQILLLGALQVEQLHRIGVV